MNAGWITAALVSAAAHVGFATWIEQAEPRRRPRPPIELQLAAPPPRVAPPKVEPPPRPPPTPPPVRPARAHKVTRRRPVPPPPPETRRVGISQDATADHGTVAVPTGVTTDGVLGTGTSLDPTLPPPPPAPPPPPRTPPKPRPAFFPSYEVTQLPKIRRAAQPEIPDAFRQTQREAVVVIEVEIDVTGRVVGARVLRHGDHGLDEAALAAARATEFEPARMGTTPVPVRYQLPYRFKVRG